MLLQVSSFPLQAVIGDFEDAIALIDNIDNKRQLNLVVDALRLSASLLRYFLTSSPIKKHFLYLTGHYQLSVIVQCCLE